MIRFSILSLLVLALAGLGCGGNEGLYPDDSAIDQNDPTGLADSVANPYGTYEGTPVQAGELKLLVLMSDKSFHSEMMVECVKAPCNPVKADGTYRFTKSSTTRYIRFYDASGAKLSRYAYKVQGKKLYLRLADSGSQDWFTMQKFLQGWCDAASDCVGQGLFVSECPGKFECQSNTCSWQCSAVQNDCTAAGGKCVALYPGTCGDGIVGDANTYSCGEGLLGVQCCLPKPKAPVCKYAGTSREGWYDADTGEKHCSANCAGSAAKCSEMGSRSEGWYTDSGAGCGGGTLIGWENCGN